MSNIGVSYAGLDSRMKSVYAGFPLFQYWIVNTLGEY